MADSKVMKKAMKKVTKKAMKAVKAMKAMKAVKAMKSMKGVKAMKAVKEAKHGGLTDSQLTSYFSQNPDLWEQLQKAPRCEGMVNLSHVGKNGAIINLVYKNTDGRLMIQAPLSGILY